MTTADLVRPAEEPPLPAQGSAPVYVWELPVRIVHWTVVLALIVLSFTGLYLYDPFFGSGGPGHPGFSLAKMRFIHESAGFVFITAVLFRMYWAVVGNTYASWRALVPITRLQRRHLRAMLRYYALIGRRIPHANGHNPLAGLAYVALYTGFLISIVTGLGLLAWVVRTPPWTTLFGWTYGLVAVEQLRLVHFLLMFVFGAFAIHHVYSAILIDLEEHAGELSSIVTGYKLDAAENEPGAGGPPPTP